ncbi:MAG: DUF5916 domain-containing protein [Pseudomonadales bacterium]|nr:DUF5916 domain-containing protein [Pseudomonadales bacterium]
MKSYPLTVPILLLALGVHSLAEAADATELSFEFPKFADNRAEITVDGKLDEAVWSEVPAFDNMVVIDPDTMKPAQLHTQSRLFYTDEGLYVGIVSQQDPDTLIARLSSRDQFINRDGFEFTLDTSGEGLYGYQFGVNLGGTLMDSTVLPERQLNREWDGPWDGATALTGEGWSGEIFLPWSMMSMPDSSGSRSMGFYVSRRVAYLNERWSWPALPRTKSAFLSALQPFLLQDVNPKRQFTFYPFGSATYNNIKKETDYKAGFDIFWRPSSNVQFTTSLNPDFGNVESDDVVVNLTSFETFFPEKRPFFLEGNEIFITTPRAEVRRGGGSRRFRREPTTLVNTRRIGGAPREPDVPPDVDIPDLELSRPSELLGAAKVTGQKGKVRYGVLTAFEDDTTFTATRNELDYRAKQDGRNFGIARAIYEDTSTGGRRAIGWISTVVSHPEEDAVVHGVDAHYLSPDKRWLWDLQLMRSDVAEGTGTGGFIDAKFIPRRGITHTVSFDYLDDKLDISDLGFIRRNDSINFRYAYMRNESDFVRLKNRQLSWFLSQEYNTDGRAVRSGLFTRGRWTLADNSRISTEINYFPDRWDDRNSDGSGSFRIKDRWILAMGWSSDSAKKIRLELDAGTQQEE